MALTDVTHSSTAFAVLGFWLVAVSLISYLIKQRLFISGAIIALGVGVIVGPVCLDWVNPHEWTSNDEESFNEVVLQVTRVVIGIQVAFTGIALPKAYLRKSWLSLTVLLVPVMTVGWLICAGLIYAFIDGLTFLECLCIGACLAPTDPILAASSVKGRYAEEHVPRHIRNLIAAESGANDGLGFPFLYAAIFLIQRQTEDWTVGRAMQEWFLVAILYQICLSVLLGAVIGYVARKTLRFAEAHRYIEHESFLTYGVGLALFCLGAIGSIGSDDLLSAFIAGNSFTWDDWFRLETEDHSFQDVIDNFLDSSVFIFIGTIIPWLTYNEVAAGLDIWRFVLIALLILLLRRLPMVLLTWKACPDIQTWKEAAFTGWFGPMGVGAVYYAQVALQKLPEDRSRLRETLVPIVHFVVVSSVLVHGITIPATQLGSVAYSRTKSVRASKSGSGTNTPAPMAGQLHLPMSPVATVASDESPQHVAFQAPQGEGENANGKAAS